MPLITKTSEILEDWERHTQRLADYFVKKYFVSEANDYWIGGDVGGVLAVNDYFFSLSDMVDYLRYRYSKNKMFSHYDYTLKCYEKDERPINIKNWIKLK